MYYPPYRPSPQRPYTIQEAVALGKCFKYVQTDMGHTKVSELMESEKFLSELKQWNLCSPPDRFPQPILINAPTGAGKTSFIRNCLVPFAQEHGRSVLYLCNRYALNMQTRKVVSKDIDSPAFSSNALDALSIYKNLIIGTYQGVDKIISTLSQQNPTILPVGYVVLDEVHFFTSDALFNAQTSDIFHKILYTFRMCQRIYLSATPQEVKDVISCEEYELYNWCMNPGSHTYIHALSNPVTAISEYRFQPDYSYIKLNFCSQLDDLVPKITSSKDKWLIFVSNKSDGMTFAEALKKKLKGDAVYYIDADTRTTEDGRRKLSIMMEYEKFKEKVLISTSLLDTGINFSDKELKHIVVDSVVPTQVKQMIGRRRHSTSDYNESGNQYNSTETVNVYIVKRSQKEIQTYLNTARDKVKLLDYYRKNPQRFTLEKFPTLTETEHQLFQSIPGSCPGQFELHTNGYAQYKLDCLMKHYEHLDGLMEMDGEAAFESEVAGWFGIKDGNWDITNDVEIEIRKQIVDAIELYKMNPGPTGSAEVKQLDEQLWDLVRPIVTKHKIKHDSESVGKGENIRNIMRALSLPYKIKLKDKVWTIEPIEDNAYKQSE